MQFGPAGRLQDLDELISALDGTDSEHLRTLPVHGIQHFVWLDAQLHELRGKLSNHEFGEVLLTTHLYVPLHQQAYHCPRTEPFSGASEVLTTPRYQKQHRCATLQGKSELPRHTLEPDLRVHVLPELTRGAAGVLIAAVLILLSFAASAAAPTANPIHAPVAQAERGVTKQLYLLPSDDSTVQLQTHVAVVSVAENADGSVASFMNAEYLIENEGEDAIELPLVLYPGIGSAQPQGVALTAGGQALAVGVGADGNLAARLQVPEDSRILLRLTYQVTVDDPALITVRYAPSVLRKWRGPTSTRIEYSLPDAIARGSWTRTSPDTWSYDASAPDEVAIKWLYDSTVPNQEFIVQFVAPWLWTRIQSAEASARAGGPAAAHLARGDLYRTLAESPAADDAVRDRFTAQAIAAYMGGLARESEASNEELAEMHIALANIYRNRAAMPGRDPVQYASLMVEEVTAALSLTDPDPLRTSELQRWLADGLYTLFDDARARNDWQMVSRLVGQMKTLPPGTIDASLIEEGEQIVLIQQALALLQRGEQEAATALAGSEISVENTSPPAELQPLFALWHITATAETGSIAIDVSALPAPGRAGEARASLNNIAASWQRLVDEDIARSSLLAVTYHVPQAQSDPLRLHVEMKATMNGEELANYLPGRPDFALLRSVLAQIGPKQEEHRRFFLREVQRSQPMDLRSAGDQWGAMAAQLERQSATLLSEDQAGDAKARLVAEMRAANYRDTADSWRNLLRDSWLLFQFSAHEDAPDAPRSWYATATSSPVVFTTQTQSVDTSIVAGVALVFVTLVTTLTGLLWWLL